MRCHVPEPEGTGSAYEVSVWFVDSASAITSPASGTVVVDVGGPENAELEYVASREVHAIRNVRESPWLTVPMPVTWVLVVPRRYKRGSPSFSQSPGRYARMLCVTRES